jgi:hypothetical protein
MDEDALGHFEEDIRQLIIFIRTKSHREIIARNGQVKRLFISVNKRWPQIRATAVVNMEVDFVLIPRAMQAEEDYIRLLNEYRNIEALRSLDV